MEAGKLRAFVIGPIGDRDADAGSGSRKSYEDAIEVFEYVIAPACKALEVEAYRADHIFRVGEINEQIFRNLRDAHIVIADMTGANPNVMYELGLRHTTGKLTIQIGEKGRIPFDISAIRAILFRRTEAGFVSARRSLIAALAEGLEHGSDPVAATRIWLESSDPLGSDVMFKLAGDQVVEDELGFLEQLADMEAGIADMTQTAERGASILEEITYICQQGTGKVINLPDAPNYSALKLAAVNQVAQELQDPSVRFNIFAQDFKSHVERASPGVEHLLREVSNSPELLVEAPEFLGAIKSLIAVSEDSAQSSESFADSLEGPGKATRLMKRVTGSIRKSALSMAQTSRRISNWKSLVDKIES